MSITITTHIEHDIWTKMASDYQKDASANNMAKGGFIAGTPVGQPIPEYARLNKHRRISKKKALEVFGKVPTKYMDIGDVAGAAWDNEYTNTPTRPFMSQSFDMNEEKYNMVADAYFADALSLTKAIVVLATELKADIQRTIMSGNFAPNTSQEIFYKGHSKPLIWDGKMYNSIDAVIGKDSGNEQSV
jgi:hypothetical protein